MKHLPFIINHYHATAHGWNGVTGCYAVYIMQTHSETHSLNAWRIAFTFHHR